MLKVYWFTIFLVEIGSLFNLFNLSISTFLILKYIFFIFLELLHFFLRICRIRKNWRILVVLHITLTLRYEFVLVFLLGQTFLLAALGSSARVHVKLVGVLLLQQVPLLVEALNYFVEGNLVWLGGHCPLTQRLGFRASHHIWHRGSVLVLRLVNEAVYSRVGCRVQSRNTVSGLGHGLGILFLAFAFHHNVWDLDLGL